MKQHNFWGSARSRGFNMGLIVRLSLAIVALAGSATLAWTLLNAHNGAHAASVNTGNTVTNPWAIVYDSNGNAWVAEPACNPNPVCIGAPNGAIEEFNLTGGNPTSINKYVAPNIGHFNPTFLQLDGAGHVWFTDPTNNAIGEVTLSNNTWQEFTAGITAHAEPFGLVRDTNGNLWFAERAAPDTSVNPPIPAGTGKIGFFNTTSKTVVETAIPTTTGQPDGMTYDAAHNVAWFAEDNAPKIGSFTPSTTGTITITEHTSNSNTGAPNPHLITLDSAGNLWYSEQGSDLVGEYNPTTQAAKQFSVAGNLCPTPGVTPTPCTNTYIDGIAVDSTGLVWFDETQNNTTLGTPVLGSLNPTSGAVTLFSLPASSGPGDGLSVDSHNNVWVSMLYSNLLGELPAGTVIPPTPTATSNTTPGVTPSPTPTLLPGPVFKTWYFAEGRVGGGFTEFLSLDNPTSNACAVDITYLYTPDRGSPLTKTVVVNVPANTRYEEGVDSDLGTYPTGPGVTDSAIVSVDNNTTSNCTGIVAERPMYYISQGNSLGANSTSDVLGVTHLGTTFYIADVATGALDGGKFSSFITILNPPNSAGSATVTASYYANSATAGTPGTLIGTDQVTVPVGTRGTIFPNNHSPALPSHVSVVVSSTQPVAVERPVYFSNVTEGNAGTVSGGADLIGVQTLSKDWLFAEGYTGGQFQENFVIANLDPAKTAATVTIKLELPTGPITEPAITIQPNSQYIWNVNVATTGNVSAEITSSGANIVAEREMFFHYNHAGDGRVTQAMGGTDVLGQNGPSAQSLYSFAEGYVNTNYDEWLTLENPTATAETIWVTLYNALGHTYTFYVNVGPASRATADIVAVVYANLYHNGDGFRGLEVAMTVQTTSTAGGPFVAERPMYSNVNGIQGGTDIIGYIGG